MSENQNPTPIQQPQKMSGIGKALCIAIVLILLSVIGSYIFFPLLGIAVVISTGAWGLIILTIAIFTIAVLLFFVIPGILVFLISSFAFVWVVLAIVLFPILFPIIMPVFILLLFLAYILRQKKS
ncbi:MAG TPA: hypothetical protein VHE99_08300 [Gammaproteobacteria bacterium]|nr:hypothetical protein [Gammaproteobacteria bacterium]